MKKYLTYNFIEYICKIRNEDICQQEVYILVNSPTTSDESSIIYFAEKFKRINIVTKNIKKFYKLQNYLEKKLGIAITVTNNKKKSLLKAKIIVNFNFDDETLNSFNINQKAIIIHNNKKATIKSKLFNGINIIDYQIAFNRANEFNDSKFNKFNKKYLYESCIKHKDFDLIQEQICNDGIKIVNLIGKNGVINNKEYQKLY